MKPLKKIIPSSPVSQSKATTSKRFPNMTAMTGRQNDKPLTKKDQPEIFFIPTNDLSPEELSNLKGLKNGAIINLKDDLLQRLLKLEQQYNYLKTLSLTDELTGLYNKRFFNKQLKIEITRTKRTGQPFCLMFIDLDNFKSINDTFGHPKGDEFLVKLSRSICQKIRPTDFACRYGGDEFVIIMPATYLVDGLSIAQRWHNLIKEVASEMEVNVSSSIGIDEFDISCTLSAEDFLNRVDKELYHAKNTGKNKICHPGRLQVDSIETRAVTPDEKDALYRASGSVIRKRKPSTTSKKRGKN